MTFFGVKSTSKFCSDIGVCIKHPLQLTLFLGSLLLWNNFIQEKEWAYFKGEPFVGEDYGSIKVGPQCRSCLVSLDG